MSVAPAISCRNVGKTFRLPHVQYSTLKGRVLHPFAGTTHDEFRALEDVSFDIAPGEFVGIIGRNGCGKSTLLKMLAGIYRADTGEVEVNGSVAPFIELGVGFNQDLSGRDNLFINGTLLGLSRRQLRERYDEIVRFAELERFMDMKLRNFSSGMQVRLAFSITIESGADILLVDEVLAVGDERFQRKCYEVFEARRAAGQTVVFVSHDMAAVQRFCDRVVLLEQGRVVEVGDARTLARTYHQINLDQSAEIPPASAEGISVADAWLESDAGRVLSARHGELGKLCVEIDHSAVESPCEIVMQVADRFRNKVVEFRAPLEPDSAGRTTAIFTCPLVMVPGSYWVDVQVEGAQGDVICARGDVAEFEVEHHVAEGGALLDVPYSVEVVKVGTPQPASA